MCTSSERKVGVPSAQRCLLYKNILVDTLLVITQMVISITMIGNE